MSKHQSIEKLSGRYTFALNPHEDWKASTCVRCRKNTFPRKFPLLILVNDSVPLALGFTCKYCAKCEFIVAHQKDLETELTIAFEKLDPSKIGSEYLVLGTVDKKIWKSGLGRSTGLQDISEHIAEFKMVMSIKSTPGGWGEA